MILLFKHSIHSKFNAMNLSCSVNIRFLTDLLQNVIVFSWFNKAVKIMRSLINVQEVKPGLIFIEQLS